jgi:hypothetical protein
MSWKNTNVFFIMSGPSWLNLREYGVCKDVRKIIYSQLSYGDRFMVEIAHGTKVVSGVLSHDVSDSICQHCGKNGYLDLLEWFLSKAGRLCWCAFREGVRNGHLPIVKLVFWARHDILDNGCWRGAYSMSSAHVDAAKGGHLHELEYLHEVTRVWHPTEYVASYAALNGHLHVLKWLSVRQSAFPFPLNLLDLAATNGKLNTVAWLTLECGLIPTTWTIDRVARAGHLHVFEWLMNNGCKRSNDECFMAAQCGHLELLQFAIANGCEYEADMLMFQAITYGHLHIVQWLRKSNTVKVLTQQFASYAAGHSLDILKWLHQEGCPLDPAECIDDSNDPFVHQWLKETFVLHHYVTRSMENMMMEVD